MKKYTTADRLKQIMSERNLKQVDILNLASPFCKKHDIKLNKNDLSQYVSGKVEPGQNKLFILGLALNVSEAWLMGFEVPIERIDFSAVDVSNIKNIEPLPKMKKVPLLGTIACGEPITAEENIEDYINMPEDTNGTFALRCKGDSMINARINDGDIVYIKEQPSVENGQIGAVLIDGEATLKRVYYYPEKETLILKAENTKYDDFIFIGSELENVKIIGKAVGFYSSIV